MYLLARLADRSRFLANGRLLLISGAVTLALMAVMFASSGRGSLAAVADRCGQPAPDVRFTTSPEGLQQFLEGCGEAGRAAYRDLQLVDLVYPAAFGLFLAAALALLLPRAFPRWSGLVPSLAVLPLVGTVLDYTENAAAWVLLERHPDPVAGVARLMGAASAGKQVVMWMSVLLVAAGLVGALVMRLRAIRGREYQRVEPAGRRAI